MSRTYDAILSGHHLEWKGSSPFAETPVNVQLVVPDPVDELSREDRRRLREEALRGLQEIGAFRSIDDPIEWQREIRKDRPLPGREE